MTNTTTINAVAEAWKPSAYVLKKYAEDMDINTRLIDADIAPYLRKVAAWVEAYEKANLTTTSMSESGVDAVAEAMANIFVNSTKDALVPMTATEAVVRINKHKLAQAAIEAYEKASVREMTLRELVYAISDVHSGNGLEAFEIAQALAKLGTIRITGGGE